MLSALTILSIFSEIFTVGVLVTGGYVFVKKYLESFNKAFLLLAGIFIFFGFYVVGVVSSQLMLNMGSSISSLISTQKINSAMLIFAALFVWLFAVEKFRFKFGWISYLFIVIAAALEFLVFSSPMNLVYRYDIIEPAIESITAVPTRYLWLFSWGVLGAAYLWRASRTSDQKEKNLDSLSGFSALLIAVGHIFSSLYLYFGEGLYLLLSWVIVFFSFLGFFLGNIISPQDEIALKPLNYLKTRILFKLALLFILMIILIVEATTIATIAISKASLSKAIIEANHQIALSVADKVKYYLKQEKDRKKIISTIQTSVEDASFAQNRTIYVVDSSKRAVVHPDAKRAAAREDMSNISVVGKVVLQKSGGEEFFDESGARLVGSYVPIPELGWGVIVSQPVWQAYFEIRRLETNSLLFVILGIVIAVVFGMLFAKNIEGSISAVISGTEAIRKGNLNYRIKTDSLDEIGRLATAFNVMTAELKESQDHLVASEKLAALGTMAAGMAHEIKNPLVALRTFTQILPLKWEDKDFRDKFASIVPTEIEKINKITENLLKFGRPSKPEFKSVNINTVLEEVLDLLENQIRKNNIRIATRFAKVPMIYGDPSQLSQAFLNMVLNAVHVMQNGGELIIKSDVGHVIQLGKITKEGFISSRKLPGETGGENVPAVFIEITDTGPGIPEETMKNMFDPFYTTKSSGTGMGLPITLRIIEEHKGSIKVRSQVGKGTTFIIILPQATSES